MDDLRKFLLHRKALSGLSFENIAALMSINGPPTSVSVVRAWFNGSRTPKADRFGHLLTALGVRTERDINLACRLKCGLPPRSVRT